MVPSSVNDGDGDGVQPNPRKRRRPAPSCQECRRRKVKCDRLEPCGHCVFSKKQCHYGQASRIVNGRHARVPYATPPQASVPAIGASPGSGTSRLTGPSPDTQQLTAQPSRGIASANTNANIDNVAAGLRDGRISLKKSCLFGQSHWTNSTLDLQKTAAVLSSEVGDSTDNEALARLRWEIGSLLQKCKLLTKHIKSSRLSRYSSFPQAYPSIAKDIADQMVHLYLTRFESAFRILHIPSFWIEYEKYWSDPTKAETILQLKIHIVTAIGATIHQDPLDTTDIYSAARQWLHTAQEWLSGPLKKNRISIGSLQVQCLLILARQALAAGGDIVWISMGTVVRTAMQMGLHRDPKHFKRMGILEGEIRRRLWATILELNVQAALDAGVPPTLTFDDFDTEAPSNVNDKDIKEQEALQEHPPTMITDSSLQRFLFQSLPSRLEVARRMNGISSDMSQMSYNELIALTTSITGTCRSCGAHISRTISSDIASFHNNLADLLLRRFILHLHRPLAGRARTDPTYYFSRKVSLDAAMKILSPAPKNAEFAHLVLLGAGIFKNRMTHASLAVASELLMEVEEQGPVEFYPSSQEPSGYRKMLIEALREALRQSAERIRLGETNVKLHMKLSMAMCQTEVEGGNSCALQQVAESAKESLETSYAIIKERAASEGVDVEFGGNLGLPEDFHPDDCDPENFSLSSNFNLDDLFFLPAEFDMDGVAACPQF